ncbi:MAG: hypothetical protein HOW73_02455 [Polyangiaceae bacterium]|nr:hypothetical protein [Polyangiaceae bacterium]
MWIKRSFGIFFLVIVPIVATGAGCEENRVATDKCKSSPDGDKCNTCCKDNGANGYTFLSGNGCTCRGG